VIVDLKVALAAQVEIHTTVLGKRRQHVVQKANATVDIRIASAIEINRRLKWPQRKKKTKREEMVRKEGKRV